MKKSFVILAALTLSLVAADKLQPLQAKLGLWEITATTQMSGQLPIPAETLAKMTPEQRERMEAMMKQRMGKGAAPTTRQTCITQEKLSNGPFNDDNKACKRTIVTSTSKVMEMDEVCTQPDGSTRTAHGKFELIGDNAMKGSMLVKATNNGRTMNLNVDLSGKFLKSDCGAAKEN